MAQHGFRIKYIWRQVLYSFENNLLFAYIGIKLLFLGRLKYFKKIVILYLSKQILKVPKNTEFDFQVHNMKLCWAVQINYLNFKNENNNNMTYDWDTKLMGTWALLVIYLHGNKMHILI